MCVVVSEASAADPEAILEACVWKPQDTHVDESSLAHAEAQVDKRSSAYVEAQVDESFSDSSEISLGNVSITLYWRSFIMQQHSDSYAKHNSNSTNKFITETFCFRLANLVTRP